MQRLRADLMQALENFDRRVSDYINNNLEAVTNAVKNQEPMPDYIFEFLTEANKLSKSVGEIVKSIPTKKKE